MLKLEREVWRKADTPNYFVTIHKDIPSFLNEKKFLSNLITAKSPYNKKGQESGGKQLNNS